MCASKKASSDSSLQHEQLTPRMIFEHLDRYVIGQNHAKRTVSIAAYSHLQRCNARSAGATLQRKSNILMIGPTGCGKTHIARTLAELLKVPFVVVDATEFTEAGYYGKDVEVMVAELLFHAGQDIQATERGIIFVDEVDKLARRSHGAKTGAGSRDIGGEGVQQSMLKLLEGREVFVPLNVTQHWNKHDFVMVNTEDILFICAGTFSDLHIYRKEGAAIGFSDVGKGAKPSKKPYTVKELTDYGMIAEFLGRLPVTVELETLSSEDMRNILTQPPDSLIREYTERFSLDEIELQFSNAALDEIVQFSLEKHSGARGLRGILEAVCHDLLFEAPERKGSRIVLDGKTVRRKLNAYAEGGGG